MKIRDVYEKDPTQNRLLNQGRAILAIGHSEPELRTLRFELTNFVCDGQYQEGLNRILRTYLTHLDQTEQPGVWVSGFYGSGKSHLIKMLQYLWTDFDFPDGAKARGLARLPEDTKDLLTELSVQARRHGGIQVVAGELRYRAEKSVRIELLGLVFKAVGLPEDYARANFLLWLRHEGIEQAVRDHVAAAGRDFNLELNNLYVSDAMAKAILAAKPGFAANAAAVKVLIESQFPDKADVTDTEMINTIKTVVAKDSKLPCTLIVLDEVQQYIGDSVDRSKEVQDLQEQCCARLGANLMFVATGQNALAGTPLLQRLQGRFPVAIELQDTDVEQVTREVVLKKKASNKDMLVRLLEDRSGEIERHLAATKIAFTTRDRNLLVQDYPLLPARRRFWERVLRAVDKAGTGAQLRTQLWIVYDAVEKTADLPLGNVVNGAFLFDSTIKSSMLRSGVLLQEISENIARQRQEPDGELRYQLCALIFLIGQLPHEGPASERLLDVLRAAYGSEWSDAVLHKLLTDAGCPPSTSLDDWLRNEFFAQHYKRFHNRPFIWHIWDGRKDGFSCLVNYHKLTHKLLETLTYSYLQDWITAQTAAAKDGKPGADLRLGAALELQNKLKLILTGEPPYDIFVRWKPIEEQPIGWNPDLNDGVRMNIRPFITADVLRKKPTINWSKDRGSEPVREQERYPWFWKNGIFTGDCINDYHLTNAQKRVAR